MSFRRRTKLKKERYFLWVKAKQKEGQSPPVGDTGQELCGKKLGERKRSQGKQGKTKKESVTNRLDMSDFGLEEKGT